MVKLIRADIEEVVLPGVELKVDSVANKAILTLGETNIHFDWNDDAQMIFNDLEGACPIELLSVLANVGQLSSFEKSCVWRDCSNDE